MSIEYAAAIIFIGICAIFDWRKMEIPAAVIYGFGAAAFAVVLLFIRPEASSLLYSLIPGMAMLALSMLTRESIGYGDGLAVVILGMLLGIRKCMAAVLTGFLLSAVFALILLIFHKVNGKSRMPYIPFLAAGLGVVLFVWI